MWPSFSNEPRARTWIKHQFFPICCADIQHHPAPMRLRQTPVTQALMRDWSSRGRYTRSLSSRRVRIDIPPSFPVTKTCPEPSYDCPSMPPMPEGLPIDREHALNGTMAAYTQQLLVCTGQQDWTSRIEDDGHKEGWGNLVRGVKRLLGRGGPYLDVSGL